MQNVGKLLLLLAASLALAGCATAPAPSGPWLDFATFERGRTTNTALACAPDICGNAEPSLPLMELAANTERVVQALRELEPSLEVRTESLGRIHARYVAVTPTLHFKDDVDVLIIPINERQSRVAVYSRSRIGLSDLGANAARIARLEASLRGRLR